MVGPQTGGAETENVTSGQQVYQLGSRDPKQHGKYGNMAIAPEAFVRMFL